MLSIPAFAATLLVFWCLRRQIAKAKSETQTEVAAIRSDFELLRAEGLPSPPPNGFNINRRLDVQRRLRSNQPLDIVAAATGWAVPEIALLQKIEKLLN